MAFIKRHLMLLSCGLLGVLSIAAMVVGILVGNVSGEMQQAESLSKNLSSLGRDCVNDTHIRQAEEKSTRIAADAGKVRDAIKKMNAREPLRKQVFPAPTNGYEAYGFRDDYRKALNGLLPNVLKAKPAPLPDEIKKMGMMIAKERADALKRGQVPPGTPPGPGAGGPGFGQPPAPPPLAPGARPGAPGKPPQPTIEELAQTDAEVRMSLVRAHETLCYASPTAIDVRQKLMETQGVPDVEPMWDAQMSLWIQQDVLGALAKVNDAAAAKLKPEDRWVANMPVKELIGIRIGDYVLGPGAAEAAGAAAASGKWVEAAGDPTPPPGDASAVFTQRTSNELYDVIQFTVDLIIDARELPTVLDGICGVNFYTPLTVSCSAPTVLPSFRGKVYGPNPIMRVRLEFEGCFFREFYHYFDGKDGKDGKPPQPFMPPSLSQQILANKRSAQEAPGMRTIRGAEPGMR